MEQLYGCLFQPLYACTWTNLRVTYSGQTRGWSENTLILTNESLSKITRLIRVNQSQASKMVTDGGRMEKVTYRALYKVIEPNVRSVVQDVQAMTEQTRL